MLFRSLKNEVHERQTPSRLYRTGCPGLVRDNHLQSFDDG